MERERKKTKNFSFLHSHAQKFSLLLFSIALLLLNVRSFQNHTSFLLKVFFSSFPLFFFLFFPLFLPSPEYTKRKKREKKVFPFLKSNRERKRALAFGMKQQIANDEKVCFFFLTCEIEIGVGIRTFSKSHNLRVFFIFFFFILLKQLLRGMKIENKRRTNQ